MQPVVGIVGVMRCDTVQVGYIFVICYINLTPLAAALPPMAERTLKHCIDALRLRLRRAFAHCESIYVIMQ